LDERQRETAEANHRQRQAARRRYARSVFCCVECGEAIDERRREQHAAIRCLECQTDHERRRHV
ncbi:MAG: TraR/DksA C4-type zinc finger protein, partial [Thiohalospira sp.]